MIQSDFEIWSALREQYLPSEYHTLFKIITGHYDQFGTLPSFEDLKYEIRDLNTQEKLFAIEAVDTDADPSVLLEYLKNEYTQKEILKKLDTYIDHSVAFENAEETLSHLHQIVIDVENAVDLEDIQESMDRINLFETKEAYDKYLTLGMNHDFDLVHQYSPRDLILIGGRRGGAKSVSCANVAVNMFERGRSSIYYSIEMGKRSILQRMCAIATGVPATRLKTRNLSVLEWEQVAGWWASRFSDSEEIFENYKQHRKFDDFHRKLTSSCKLLPTCQLDVVYDPQLTVSKIRADVERKVNTEMDIGLIVVDYINKVKLNATPSKRGSFDWMEQIEVSTALKTIAAELEIPIYSPYQMDASGEARFAKGILDDADAAYKLHKYEEEDACITFECTKMRDGPMRDFTSEIDWDTLKIGPNSTLTPKERESSESTGESIQDIEL